MKSSWRDAFLAYSMTNEFQRQVKKAKTIIKKALSQYKKPYVAFSGGKDSTCVLHLVFKQQPELLVLHWDYGKYYVPRQLHLEIITNAIRIGAKNIRIETSEKYDIYKRNARGVLGMEMIGKLIPKLMQESYDCCFIGLRKDESYKRKRRLTMNKNLTKMPEVSPIADWSWMDVWAYIVSNKIPYLSIYDEYCEVLGYENARFTTFFDKEFSHLGAENIDSMLMWKFKNFL